MFPSTKLFGDVEIDRIVNDRYGKPSVIACWGKHKHLIVRIISRDNGHEKMLVLEVQKDRYDLFVQGKIGYSDIFSSFDFPYGVIVDKHSSGKADLTYMQEEWIRQKFGAYTP